MKKILVFLASLTLLTGCNSAASEQMPILKMENGLPTIYPLGESEFETYLMLSRYGQIKIGNEIMTKGAVSELFYENTVVWKAEPGTPLPDASQVSSTVSGASFRGWAYYDEDNDHVFPDYYTVVPNVKGLALKAIFDGTSSGGGGGGGSSTSQGQVSNVTYTLTNFENWVPNDGAKVFAWSWGGGSGGGAWSEVTLQYFGEDHAYTNVTGTFEAPNDIVGFNLARCSSGTTSPDWKVTGDAPGRIYNKTANVDTTSGVTTYSAPQFVDYEYIA